MEKQNLHARGSGLWIFSAVIAGRSYRKRQIVLAFFYILKSGMIYSDMSQMAKIREFIGNL